MDILETLKYLRPNENVAIHFGKEPTLSNVFWVSQRTYTSVDNTSNLNVIWNEEANVYTKAPFTIPTQQECEDVWNSTVRNKVALKDLRTKRNALLEQTDKYIVADYPHATLEERTKWTTYRQALRDLPSTTEDPANPVWPEKPPLPSGETRETNIYEEFESEKSKVIILQNVVYSLIKRVQVLENA